MSLKLPIITATATIIERLTASAATEIDRRGIAAARLACASMPSTPSSRARGTRRARASPKMIAGTSSDAPMMVANDEA